MTSYRVARLDEIEEFNDGRAPWRAVRHHFGITGFGVNAWTGQKVGDRIINEHDEDEPGGHQELYLVLEGRARFELEGEQVDAPAGTLVFVPPGIKRTAFAEESETTLLAVGGTPGAAADTIGWELVAPVQKAYNAGDYAAAAEQGRRLLDEHTQYALLFYNVACCESLSNQSASAVEHLRRAIDLSDDFRTAAREDSDFDPIREDPGFKKLIAE
jgi:hypothetical protein